MTGPPAKQRADTQQWIDALATVKDRLPESHADRLIEVAAERVRSLPGRVAYGWSGGKESVALEAVAAAAGVGECVLVICELEFPEFLRWATDHMPPGMEVENTGQDLEWLRAHPDMLFPRTATLAGKWFKEVQHRGQRNYYRRHGLDAMLVGRRKGDGNYVGKAGQWWYRNAEDVVRASPMYDWSNDDLLAVIAWRSLPLAPCYFWPRGFRVGTGPWAARQWCPTTAFGWSEVWQIDADVVRRAAAVIPSAAQFMEGR